MAVRINGKVLRNIPEQVSKNMSDIAFLKEELLNKEYTIQDMQIVAGHLIITTYGGEQIDAGEIKNIVSMSIDGSQHLIATYNDGTTEDLGAIFSGNVNISGDLSVSGDFTASSIVETMNGYSWAAEPSLASRGVTLNYVGVVKTGNKITFAVAGEYAVDDDTSPSWNLFIGRFTVPADILNKLEIMVGTAVDGRECLMFSAEDQFVAKPINLDKLSPTLQLVLRNMSSGFTAGETYAFRYEATFLLSENLAQ